MTLADAAGIVVLVVAGWQIGNWLRRKGWVR